jgi:hypothetical protein
VALGGSLAVEGSSLVVELRDAGAPAASPS